MTLAVAAIGPRVSAQEASSQEASTKVNRPVEFALPVTGLTTEKAEAALEPLRAFTVREFVCPRCSDSRPSAGDCHACKTPREEQTRRAFSQVTASPDATTITFRLEPGAFARLSSLESLLRSKMVTVKRDAIVIYSPAGLVFSGGKAADDATRLDEAIRTAGHREVASRFDEESREVIVTFERNPPTWKRLTEIGTGLTERPLQLTDVVWSSRASRS